MTIEILAACLFGLALVSVSGYFDAERPSPRERETYNAVCKLYLMEYYPNLIEQAEIDIAWSRKTRGGFVEVAIDVFHESLYWTVSMTIKVNDFENGDMYVKTIDDVSIEKFKREDLKPLL